MLKAHAQLAQEIGIPRERVFVVENGTPIEFGPNGARQHDRLPGGYVFVDGSGVGDIGPAVLRDREVLARDGFVVAVARRGADGKLCAPPEIITRGFVYLKEAEPLIQQLSSEIAAALVDIGPGTAEETVRQRMADALSRTIYSETKRRPVLIPVVA